MLRETFASKQPFMITPDIPIRASGQLKANKNIEKMNMAIKPMG